MVMRPTEQLENLIERRVSETPPNSSYDMTLFDVALSSSLTGAQKTHDHHSFEARIDTALEDTIDLSFKLDEGVMVLQSIGLSTKAVGGRNVYRDIRLQHDEGDYRILSTAPELRNKTRFVPGHFVDDFLEARHIDRTPSIDDMPAFQAWRYQMLDGGLGWTSREPHQLQNLGGLTFLATNERRFQPENLKTKHGNPGDYGKVVVYSGHGLASEEIYTDANTGKTTVERQGIAFGRKHTHDNPTIIYWTQRDEIAQDAALSRGRREETTLANPDEYCKVMLGQAAAIGLD